MKLLLSLLLIAVSAAAGTAVAAPAAEGTVTVLTCRLTHSTPRDAKHKPKPFTQHFRVDMGAKTVDGVAATVTADKIGWEPPQSYLRPYATLTLPDWKFHEVRWHGRTRDEVTGTCTPQP